MEATTQTLNGQRILITGAAKRIGAHVARRLHADGANVGVHYRSSDRDAQALCAALNAERKDSAAAFGCDLTTDSVDELIDRFVAWAGGLDALINNASSFYPTPIGTITAEQWDDLMGSNLKAPLFLAQAAQPWLEKSNGNIVNMVDIHARRPLRDHPVYGSAKAGLAMLTLSLAKDMAPKVRVNGIAPGAILWPESGMSDTVQESIVEQIPLARSGTPNDIAEGIVYLLTAGYVTGQIIAIDGGRSVGW